MVVMRIKKMILIFWWFWWWWRRLIAWGSDGQSSPPPGNGKAVTCGKQRCSHQSINQIAKTEIFTTIKLQTQRHSPPSKNRTRNIRHSESNIIHNNQKASCHISSQSTRADVCGPQLLNHSRQSNLCTIMFLTLFVRLTTFKLGTKGERLPHSSGASVIAERFDIHEGT